MTDINPEDLDVSVIRPGAAPRGQGGQTTGEYDSYVRVTHKPTGITVDCDTERSQLMNKDRALHELARQLRERQEPDLAEHIRQLHPRLTSRGATPAERHANDHFGFGSMTHHHGPNAGPHARPRGWRDGSGVVMTGTQAPATGLLPPRDDPDALLNPALLIRDRQVAAMHLTPGNVLRVLVDGYWQDSKVVALSVDPDGVPCLILGDASTDDMDAREAEARRIGGPAAP